MEKYNNRQAAGRILAEQLKRFTHQKEVLVLALPRGGVPVAFEIAKALHAPLDVFIVRKLGAPDHEELAMGAIAMGEAVVFNDDIIKTMEVNSAQIQSVIDKEKIELKRRDTVYRGNHMFPPLKNKNVILVDDGIATGATMRAAILALRKLNPANIIVAVPVAENNLCEEFSLLADHFICPLRPYSLSAVGAWYEDFSQTEDEEVHDLLKRARVLAS